MKRVLFTYISILFLVACGSVAWGQTTKYRIELSTIRGGNTCYCPSSNSSIDFFAGGLSLTGSGPFNRAPTIAEVSASRQDDATAGCAGSCTKRALLVSCTSSGGLGGGVNFISTKFSCGTGQQSTCVNNTYKVIVFATPGDITTANGSTSFCDNETLTLNTAACPSINNPTLIWEALMPSTGVWKQVSTSTTGTITLSASDIFTSGDINANYGKNINFRVSYQEYPDLGYGFMSAPTGPSSGGGIQFNTQVPIIPSGGYQAINPVCSNGSGTVKITQINGSPIATEFRLTLEQQSGGSWNPINQIGNVNPSVSSPATFSNISATGNYRIVVANEQTNQSASCGVSTIPITFSTPPALTLSPPTCTNCSVGGNPNFTTYCKGGTANIQLSIGGGTAPYRYRVGTGSYVNITGSTLSLNLAAGSHTIEVIDNNGCSATPASYTVNISEPAEITSTITPIAKTHGKNVSCFGAADGEISVRPSGGIGPFNLALYKTGVLIDSKTNIAKDAFSSLGGMLAGANDYTVVMSESGASSCTKTFSVAPLTQPDAIGATTNALLKANGTHLTCASNATGFSPDGKLEVSPQGGTGPFTVHLKDGSNIIVSQFGVAQGATTSLEGLSAGVAYTLEVIDETFCGSYSTTLAPLTAPTPPNIALNLPLKANGTHLSCQGGNDGVIEVTLSNGSNASNFNVSIGTDLRTGVSAGTPLTFGGLATGLHTIEVTEINQGCKFQITASLTEPAPVLANIVRGAIQANGVAHISCNGGNDGSISVRPQTGGNGAPYTIVLQNQAGFSATQTNVAAGVNHTFTGLVAGIYSVAIRDKDGCSTVFTQETSGAGALLELTQPDAINVGAFNTRNVSCMGGNDGTVNVVINGGNLYDPAGIKLLSIDQPTAVFAAPTQIAANEFRWEGLAAGNYRVTISDSKGCILQDIAPWSNSSFSINNPAQALALNVSNNVSVSCQGLSDGSITVAGAGGWAAYVYSKDGTNFSASPSASFTFDNLPQGNHQFWVKDALGCVSSIQVQVIEPPVLVPNIASIKHVSCNGGNDGVVTLGATGGWGAGSYTYSSQPNSSFSSNATFNTLSAGTYTFYVRTNGNCPTPINVTIAEPAVLTASIEPSKTRHISCQGANDGATTLNIAGGTAPYQVSANGGIAVAGNFIEGLVAGNNQLQVEDALGCTVLVNVVINEPAALTLNLVQKKETACLDAKGMAQVAASGGTAPYSYQWFDDQNNALGTGTTLNNLPAGGYLAKVQDANGCSTSLLVGIATLGAPQMQVTATTPASCDVAGDGSATIQVVSGVTPVTVLWDNGQTSLTATGLTSGRHLVTLTDGDGCQTTEEVQVPLAAQMLVQASLLKKPSCFAGCDGAIEVQVSNGTAPYSYAWNVAGQNGARIDNLCAGYYAVTVTDAKGCTTTQTFQLTAPTPLALNISENKAPACFGGCDGRITVDANGGTAPYSYQWAHATSANAATADGLCTGVYSVTITDAQGCQLTQDIRLNEPNELVLNLAQSNDPLCQGATNGRLAVTVNGGVTPYTYVWSTPGQANLGNQASIEGIGVGVYTLTVKDANGCEKSATYALNDPAPLEVTLVQEASKDPDCFEGCNGVLRVQAQGGTAPYTYLWSNGQKGKEATGLCAGQHQVTISDANGCQVSKTYELLNPAPVEISLPQTVTLCPGQRYRANAGNAGASYEWRFENQVISNHRVVDLSAAGTYTLTVTNFKGCVASTTLDIISAADALKADFTMLSKGVVGDTIAAINLTFPEAERVDWRVSGDNGQRVLLNAPQPFEQGIIFKETGVYQVTMWVYSGNCRDSLTKTIEIFNTEQEAEGGRKVLGYQPEVKIAYAKAYPNPTFGNFKVYVKLSLAGKAKVSIRSAQTSGIIAEQSQDGDTDYTFGFDLPKLPYGIYFVVIETAGANKTLKLLVH